MLQVICKNTHLFVFTPLLYSIFREFQVLFFANSDYWVQLSTQIIIFMYHYWYCSERAFLFCSFFCFIAFCATLRFQIVGKQKTAAKSLSQQFLSLFGYFFAVVEQVVDVYFLKIILVEEVRGQIALIHHCRRVLFLL